MAIQDEVTWFEANQDALRRAHLGKVLVVREQSVRGAFDINLDAINFAEQNGLDDGSTLVRHVDWPPNDKLANVITISFGGAGGTEP